MRELQNNITPGFRPQLVDNTNLVENTLIHKMVSFKLINTGNSVNMFRKMFDGYGLGNRTDNPNYNSECIVTVDCQAIDDQFLSHMNSIPTDTSIHDFIEVVNQMGVGYISCWYNRPLFNPPLVQDMIDNFDVNKLDLSNEIQSSIDYMTIHYDKATPDETDRLTDSIDGIAIIITKDQPRRRVNIQRIIEWLHIQDRVVLVDCIWIQSAPHEGCLKSHQTCVRIAKESGWDNVLVFEDDAIFRSDAFDIENDDFIVESLDVIESIKQMNRCIDFVTSNRPNYTSIGIGLIIRPMGNKMWEFEDVDESVIRVDNIVACHCVVYGSNDFDRIIKLTRDRVIDQSLGDFGTEIYSMFPFVMTQMSCNSTTCQNEFLRLIDLLK